MTQADLTRERLVRAALELFTAQGYHETTTPQIAKKAGVAEGTIYRHFTSKQHCFNELYRTAARWAGQLVKDADALKVGPREKLAELARGLVTGATHEAAVARSEVGPRRSHPRRSSNSSISGGANTRIGTPTTPIPRLTYSWLLPRWKCPITYLVIKLPGDQPIRGR